MIKVDMIDAGVFQVFFTDGDLDTMVDICIGKNVSPDDVLRGLLMFCVGIYQKASLLERSQDELEGKNEGMGRG